MALFVGFTHLAAGGTSGAAFSEDAITRTALVLGQGARQNIGAMPILGGVVTRDISHALLYGQCLGVYHSICSSRSLGLGADWNDRALHRGYNSGDDLGAMHGCEPDWCGSIFDVVVVSVGDMWLNTNDPERLEYKTTKVWNSCQRMRRKAYPFKDLPRRG